VAAVSGCGNAFPGDGGRLGGGQGGRWVRRVGAVPAGTLRCRPQYDARGSAVRHGRAVALTGSLRLWSDRGLVRQPPPAQGLGHESSLVGYRCPAVLHGRPSWCEVHNEQIADQVVQLAAAVRSAEDHVNWILHSGPDSISVADPALGQFRPMEGSAGVHPAPDEGGREAALRSSRRTARRPSRRRCLERQTAVGQPTRYWARSTGRSSCTHVRSVGERGGGGRSRSAQVDEYPVSAHRRFLPTPLAP
jgi:hypothetical protein